MSVQIQEQQQRPTTAPTTNGVHPPEDVVARPAGVPVAEPVTAVAPAPAARRRPAFLTRRVLLPVLAVVLIVVGVFGFNSYREGQLYVSTENAQLTGQPVQVGAMNAGRVESITPSIGATVKKGDVIAQVALPSQTGMGQNGQPKMGFLGVGDTRVDVQAPVDGVVIAEPVAIGASVAAGQSIVSIVDPTQLLVIANIEETNVGRVKVGQLVRVHIDALGADIPGKVEAITPATANTFSMLPSSNASGNFTKVTQLVPVRISVNLGNQPLLLGANVEVKIRVVN
ncbi:MAG: HlyD family efflux transporter periplasmic adaptor subunit [Chloroflexi bacterium]|nr:HlyD family efflux transporter periplasmic adaptor subunit [Chloroflexota bacterium]